jgi:phycocyanobilin lyase beta subunit
MHDEVSALIAAVDRADSATGLLEAVEALAEVQATEAITTLIEVLGYNNPGAAVAAVDGLVAIGQPAVPILLAQFCGHNYTARSWAIRALAGIGDPRGLPILLTAATTDFSFSVRRSATRGLGTVQWQQFLPEVLPLAQQKALETLIAVAQQDEEWVVRYAAIVGLQTLAESPYTPVTIQEPSLKSALTTIGQVDVDNAVKARAWMTINVLTSPQTAIDLPPVAPLLEIDWGALQRDLVEIAGT